MIRTNWRCLCGAVAKMPPGYGPPRAACAKCGEKDKWRRLSVVQ